MVKRFLVTTSMEDSWCEDEPVLFLGEWCRLYSRKEFWSKLDANILPYHWDDRTKLYGDYQYLKAFNEQLLQDLTAQLNQIHDVEHSLHYWRILIGPWLGYFIQILFDRWSCIQEAVNTYELSGTVVLIGNEETMVPNDMADFSSRLIIGNEWDHYLYATIIQQYTKVKCVKKEKQGTEVIPSDTIPATNLKLKIKRNLLSLYARVVNILSRDQDAFFLSTYMSLVDEIKIHFRLREVPQLWRLKTPVQISIDVSQRQWTVNGKNYSDFEHCARSLIPRQIPAIYLEGYSQLMMQVAGLAWPKKPKLIFTSNSYSADDVFKAWTAEKVEKGTPLVIGQHGGHYGTGLWSFTEDHEISISNAYLSWGWSEPGQDKIKPVGQFKRKPPSVSRHMNQKRALMVTTTLPRKSYRMYSSIVSRQWLDYFNDNCSFVNHLPELIRNALIVRLHSQDRCWDQVRRWQDRFPDLCLDKCQSSIKDMILQCRIVICTYNATTYLESFTMDVPTVIYWNPNHWELRDSAIPYFEMLKRVGILHETPESAAQHVITIWDDVDTWWNSPEIREVLDCFKARYCHLPNNLLDRVEGVLREVITTSKQSGA